MSNTPRTDAKERETVRGELATHAHYGWKVSRAIERELTVATARIAELEKNDARYQELIYAVGNKWPGESRHETALRYIRQAEAGSDKPAMENTNG